ncbi:MAG: hypothetical protein AABO57_11200 [Acidobacteriota bacterium]
MEPAFYPVLGALIGALAVVGGALLNSQRQARLEREKWLRGLSDAFANDIRSAVKELATDLAKASHSMCWLCWLARYGPSRLTQKRIDQYDEEIHALLPRITGLHAVIAGMDQRVYADLARLVEQAIEMDAAIGDAGLRYVSGKPETAAELAKYHDKSAALEKELPRVVAKAISGYAMFANARPA